MAKRKSSSECPDCGKVLPAGTAHNCAIDLDGWEGDGAALREGGGNLPPNRFAEEATRFAKTAPLGSGLRGTGEIKASRLVDRFSDMDEHGHEGAHRTQRTPGTPAATSGTWRTWKDVHAQPAIPTMPVRRRNGTTRRLGVTLTREQWEQQQRDADSPREHDPSEQDFGTRPRIGRDLDRAPRGGYRLETRLQAPPSSPGHLDDEEGWLTDPEAKPARVHLELKDRCREYEALTQLWHTTAKALDPVTRDHLRREITAKRRTIDRLESSRYDADDDWPGWDFDGPTDAEEEAAWEQAHGLPRGWTARQREAANERETSEQVAREADALVAAWRDEIQLPPCANELNGCLGRSRSTTSRTGPLGGLCDACRKWAARHKGDWPSAEVIQQRRWRTHAPLTD